MNERLNQNEQKNNPWKWEKGRNPYKHNAFLTLDIDPNLTNPRAIASRVNKRKRLVQRAPDRAVIQVKKLTPADVTEAAATLDLPNERLTEELFCHRSHQPDKTRFQKYIDYFSTLKLVEEDIPSSLPITNLSALYAVIPEPKARSFPRAEPENVPHQSIDVKQIIKEEIEFDL